MVLFNPSLFASVMLFVGKPKFAQLRFLVNTQLSTQLSTELNIYLDK